MTRRVTSDANGLLLDGTHVPLFSGEIHYWRLAPDEWGRVLDSVRDLGFGVVSVYVPWAVHENPDRTFEFGKDARDLVGFLSLAEERGLLVVARIGPNSGAELETSGWPRRVLDDPRCQARRPDGRGYLLPTSVHQAFMPSYASRQTLAEIAGWYDAVAPVVAQRQWPDGPVVAVHVDNEMAYHFQPHAYAMDYHPDAIAQFRSVLQDRYGELAALNAAWGTSHSSWAEVEPPRDGRDRPEERRLDWVRFREEHLRRSLSTLAGMIRERGVDRVPLVHNDYPRLATPLDQGALERSGAVDIAAADVYATASGGRYVRDVARQLAGSTVLPHLAEMGVGWITLPWLLPMAVTPTDVEHCTWRGLAGGARAANVFMLVGRDRWFASPLDEHGGANEPLASHFRRLLRLYHELEWPKLRRDVRVLLLDNRDEGRLVAARAVRGDLVPPFAQVLPLDRRLFDGVVPADLQAQTWDREVRAALDAAGHEWDSATTDAPPELDAYDLVVVPYVDALGADALAVLDKTTATVVAGPCPLESFSHAESPQQILDLLERPEFRTSEALLDLTRLTGAGREVLVALNAGSEALRTRVEWDGALTLIGRWREEVLTGDGGVEVSLPGWGVQVWEVSR